MPRLSISPKIHFKWHFLWCQGLGLRGGRNFGSCSTNSVKLIAWGRGFFFFFFFFFFSQGFLSRTLTTHRTAGKGRGPSYSTLPLPPAHEHSDIYLQLCTWDDYHIFLIATLVFTRLLLDEIYHLIELLFDWLMM